MKRLFEDTTEEAERVLIEGYRRMPDWRKFKCIDDLNRFMAATQLEEIRARYPDANEHELRMRLASRWLEPELMLAAYGWDVRERGY